MHWVAANLERVRERLHAACRRAGRDAAGITLVCVTKAIAPAGIRAAWAAGLRHFGENRLQEAQPKIAQLTELAGVTWHLIGHLQTNKVTPAAACFQVVHSIDSARVAAALAARAAQRRTRIAVLLQVNVSGEATKHGVPPQEAEPLARQLRDTASLEWRGLMTMAPLSDDPEQARPVFRALRELREQLQRALGAQGLQLSMGMSHDFPVAVEEGADMVRIGSAIFQENFWQDRTW